MNPDFAALADAFVARFSGGDGDVPSVGLRGVRVPGRVNLIGDHIDYNGLPVLPMAIHRELRMVFRPRSDHTIRVENLQPTHAPVEFTTDHLPGRGPAGAWANYILAAVRELAPSVESGEPPLMGFDALMSSTLPSSAGLSSSSALVVATGLALMDSNDRVVERGELARRMARAERFVGTEGGGMDHAVVLCAEDASALFVHFAPPSTRAIAIPPGWCFLIAHSLERAEKSGAAQGEYNRRTRECHDALDQLGESSYAELLSVPADDIEGSGGGVDDLLERARHRLSGSLWRRFRHVVTEYGRVLGAVDALAAGDLRAMGRLMSASHASLSEDFEVSTPRLDALVEMAVGAGAAGARLTGAGFGGAVVALCDHEGASGVVATLEAEFFAGHSAEFADLADVVFVAEASPGATLHRL